MKRARRTCPRCGKEYPFTPKHWYIERVGEEMRWKHRIRICRYCKREQTAAHHKARRERIRNDPVLLAAERKKSAEATLKWRRAHPERSRDAVRRYEQRLRKDPERYKRRLENRRIQARLREERNGRALDQQRRIIEVKNPPDPWLPIAPLLEVVRRQLELLAMADADNYENHRPVLDRESFCESIGITSRTLLDWENGKRRRIRFLHADEILTALGLNWWDVWEGSDLSERTMERLTASC